MKRLAALVLAGGSFVFGASAPARAQQTSVDITVDVTDARKSECTGGQATWSVDADITIRNTSDGDGQVTNVAYDTRYKVGSADHQTAPAQATDDGGLAPGTVVPPGETRTYQVTVSTTIACDTTSAQLQVHIDFESGHTTFFASDDFVSGGTQVPVTNVGLITAAGAGAVALSGRMINRRRTR